MGNATSSGMEFPHQLCLVFFVPEKQPHTCTVTVIYGIAKQKATIRLSILCTCLFLAKERMFAGSLVLGEAICHLPNVLQEGEHSPLVLSRRSLHHFVCSCVNTLFPGALARPSFFQKLHTSRTSEFELYMISASKVCDIQYPFFLSLWSKDFFFFPASLRVYSLNP